VLCSRRGATENARPELSAPSKMQGWKMQDWKYRHQTAGVENARLELSAPNYRGGKCGTKQLWKAKTPVGLELLLIAYF